jgi:hypothetical protein
MVLSLLLEWRPWRLSFSEQGRTPDFVLLPYGHERWGKIGKTGIVDIKNQVQKARGGQPGLLRACPDLV